ncbi:hypothetical protein QJS10_CPB17g01753 [Acorus calamus]|uniref:SAC3/GANP/THP3 conserved domain-containing protein n=1 Tax=Acorus calamus TaxID=4465 RepID=A0AAV9CUE0_ACOCL|nr:hypothetical protein QJS10_CPB17g01753 [Acorus calamus]
MDGGGGSSNQGRNSRFRGPRNPSRSSRSDLRPSLPGNSDRRRPPSTVAEDSAVEDRGGPFIGTCPDMCPAKERAQRERLRDLSVFERLNGNPGKTSSNLAVKKFCRTIFASEMAVADIRPLPVLQDTLRYLFRLLETSGYQFEMVHDFIFDRMRSIRQDLSLQHIVNDQAIQMYEEMETETESLCKACGLEICVDETGNKFLPTKQTGFSLPQGFQNYSFQGFDRFERSKDLLNKLIPEPDFLDEKIGG